MIQKIANGYILHNFEDSCSIEQHDIFIQNGKVISAEYSSNFTTEIDYSGFVLIPSFFNMHCHLGESIFKGISGEQWTLKKYLEYTETFQQSLTSLEQDRLWNESAFETVCSLYEAGISGFCAGRAIDFPTIKMNRMAGYPIMNSAKLKKFRLAGIDGFQNYLLANQSETCSVGIFLHSLYKNDVSSLLLAKACMDNGAEFITVHVAEDTETAELEKSRFGKTAVQTLQDYGLLTNKTILVHCGFVEDCDFSLIAKSGSSVAVCPISNQFLNNRLPDISLLDTYQIPWYLSTDGLATGRTFSLFKQGRVLKQAFPYLSWHRIFQSFTLLPARIFGRNHYSGNIRPGEQAVFLAVQTTETNIDTFFEGLFHEKWNWHLFYGG